MVGRGRGGKAFMVHVSSILIISLAFQNYLKLPHDPLQPSLSALTQPRLPLAGVNLLLLNPFPASGQFLPLTKNPSFAPAILPTFQVL